MSYRDRIDPGWKQNLPRDPTRFVGFDAEVPDSFPIVDRILPPQTSVHFVETLISGILPSGRKTQHALLPGTAAQKYLAKPYSTWSPGPHDLFSSSPIDHVMVRIGSHLDSARLQLLDKNVHAVKSRIWEGIMPVSEKRWSEKGLNSVEWHAVACQQLSSVIEVFAYLNHPIGRHCLLETITLIRGHWKDFENCFNALTAAERDCEGPVPVAQLWDEFVEDLFTVITTRAHSWVLGKVNRLKHRDRELLRHTHSHPDGVSTTAEQLAIMNRIHDATEIAAHADYSIFLHLEHSDPPAPGPKPSFEQRRAEYHKALRLRSRQKTVASVFARMSAGEEVRALNHVERSLESVREQSEAQNEVRTELRGEPGVVGAVAWLRKVKEVAERVDKKWGFVMYRLTYGQTDEEWRAFMEKLEGDLKNWGDAGEEIGVEDVRGHATLEWHDGKELGIEEGDVEGARRHFTQLKASNEGSNNPWYNTSVFLTIDSSCYASYSHTHPLSTLLFPGDIGGFVLGVDTGFSAEEQAADEHADETPFYSGQMRILSTLVFSDVFPLMFTQTQFLDDLWPLALRHPELLYVGPTVPAQLKRWKEVWGVKARVFDMAANYVNSGRI
ncbi:hypothetical protein BCR34DRAFT_597171 [Clohesyomyces aquaticus]|uniref:Uncharacterized protein n=1 Tax=Clohesyomyces aquaticus TaxID=1231657 RepID=A0A1Y2A3I5_9PLEO|nr:hypothetical protein BCR34DRAFT_597171 [Clohesyomyces aquaticus]